ncbi:MULTISPECIES: ABC transporter substrate-binding protein [unclassified Nocardioides]|jgi:peptide/nickel transport system substrate-binding protein|uniref:ABC transporter substrate-binding protein n=1 Tax=unclassified Nocardioides TaxID=2615069 RepID=UPI00070385BD|nr:MULTISPECIES: ABC transporter substrate-binding protein [unclassified Nocardioides]KRC49012.1 ABC transporter substrate-binding protein [Nocardioides sp. Root79]KRC75413.1 ABC transporter substrate-binding protein [Nocardioides sp. Root240]
MASKKKRMLAVTAGALLASTVLAACGSGDDDKKSEGAGETGGTLYFNVEKPIDHWDPQRTYVGTDISKQSRLVYRELVTFGTSEDAVESAKPLPDLATDTGTASDGGKVWQFTLRDGVKWEDGSDITCEDLKYGLSRNFATDVIVGGPAFYILSYLDIPADADGTPQYKGPYTKKGQDLFDKAVTCDGKTITYNFNKPWPDFNLAIAALHFASPYRAEKDQGDKSNYSVFSSGPYKLEGTWEKESGGTFVRNPEYDKATDDTDSRNALPDKIVFKMGTKLETTYDAILANKGDAACTVSDNRLPPSKFSEIPNVQDRYQNPDSPYADYLWFNTKKLPLEVRQALAMATNREGWIAAGGGERAYTPAYSVVNPAVAGYKEVPTYKDIPLAGDPDAAKKILDEAGIKTPYKIEIRYPQSETADKQAAALKDTWDKAGFTVTLSPEGDVYYSNIQKPDHNYDVGWAGWGADWPSPMTVLPPLFDSRANIQGGSLGQDYGKYEGKAFNDKITEAQNATDLDTQITLLQEADQILADDMVYMPLEIAKFNWVTGKNVDFHTTPGSNSFPDLGLIGLRNGGC